MNGLFVEFMDFKTDLEGETLFDIEWHLLLEIVNENLVSNKAFKASIIYSYEIQVF